MGSANRIKSKNATDSTSIEHVGTALQSRPARAIVGLEIRTGLETRPHIFYHLLSRIAADLEL